MPACDGSKFCVTYVDTDSYWPLRSLLEIIPPKVGNIARHHGWRVIFRTSFIYYLTNIVYYDMATDVISDSHR